jgi:hypothetical protein
MNVDVHFGCGHLKEKQHDRKYGRGQNVAVRLDDRVLDEAIADEPAVHKDEYGTTVELLDLGLGDEAVEANLSRLFARLVLFFGATPGWRLWKPDVFERLKGGNGEQLVEHILAEDLIHALAVTGDGWRDQHRVRGGVEFEVFARVRQGIVRDQRSNVGELGGLRLQEFLASGGIEKKIANGD